MMIKKVEKFKHLGHGKLVHQLNDRLLKYLKSCHDCILFIMYMCIYIYITIIFILDIFMCQTDIL